MKIKPPFIVIEYKTDVFHRAASAQGTPFSEREKFFKLYAFAGTFYRWIASIW